ncbi:MAG TPA: elongation factor G [Candidatus Faecicola pullistercoris]|nr:elongation factor G [Candidatus Faecicola pullistercoris]
MSKISTSAIRNVALIGHSGEGKTSLAEAILFNAKSIDRLGKVDNGNSTMDYDPEEISRKISISLGVGYANWKDVKINVIDTPGFFDFEGEVVSALHVADSAVVVTSASGQLSVGTEKMLDMAKEKKIPAILFVNGVNKENSSFADTIAAIREKYKNVVVAEIPVMDGLNMVGSVNVLEGKAYDLGGKEIEIPAGYKAMCDEFRAEMVEIAAESNDDYMMKFFDEGDLSDEEMLDGIQIAVKQDRAVLALGGTATANIGITRLMDAIVKYMPDPTARNNVGKDASGKEIAVKCDAAGPVCVQIFKTIVDPFFGKLNIFKVISGTVKGGLALKNVTKDSEEKISTIYFLKGKNQEAADSVIAGDIGAFAKLSNVSTGDTLCGEGINVSMPEIVVPPAVFSMAIYAKKTGDEDKIFAGLNKLKDEDISFAVIKNQDTNEMLLSGIGEPHLDILNKKLKNKFGCEAELREPRIAYRETIKKTVEAEGKHKKQSGGAGQFGQCSVRFEPGAEDGEFEFVDAVVGGAVPRQFIPAVEKGLREAIKKGVLAGYPMVNLKCTLFDGKYHPVDSKEIAFITAAKLAYADGCSKANPVFLEPIMEVRVVVPDSYLGDIMGDMNKRRGRILGTDLVDGKQVITAEVPQGEMAKYATDLRSMTQGRGMFTMKFVRYEEVPSTAAAKIIEDAKKRAENE